MATAKQIRANELENPNDPNVRDPEHAHELGGTLGMTAGGVAAGIAAGVGAAVMTGGLAIPAAAVVAGAALGGAAGGRAGESIARAVNPTAEEKYWEENFESRPYVVKGREYDTYRNAYRYGIDSYDRFEGRSFNEIESQLTQEWETSRGVSPLSWDEARDPVRDAYDRLHTRSREVK